MKSTAHIAFAIFAASLFASLPDPHRADNLLKHDT